MPPSNNSEAIPGTRDNPFNYSQYTAIVRSRAEGNNPYIVCENCNEVQRFSLMTGNVCDSCYDELHQEEESEDEDYFTIDERMYTAENLAQFQSSESGKIITSPRVFSAEFECYAPNGRAQSNAEEALSEHIGVSGDGSLGSRGVEFQTPKLKGKNGEQTIRDICKVLNDNGFTVNKDTGLHIHLDGRALLPRTLTTSEPVALKQLWQFYVAFDEVMLSFLPETRRKNRYCRSMKESQRYSLIEQAKTQRDIEALWYKVSATHRLNAYKEHHYHDSRYNGINLHSLLGEKHLEVRFHSGTLNPTKILEWVNMHQRIADMASEHKLITSERMLELTLEQKTRMFFAILQLPERARKYFMRRQEQFAPEILNLSLPPVPSACSEDELITVEA